VAFVTRIWAGSRFDQDRLRLEESAADWKTAHNSKQNQYPQN